MGHLSLARQGFQAQVPDWVPMGKDDVVLMSGVAELALAGALALLPGEQRRLGTFAAAFFAGVFPGNIAQYTGHRDALGLSTDPRTVERLFGQPVLIAWALWSTRSCFEQTARPLIVVPGVRRVKNSRTSRPVPLQGALVRGRLEE